MFQSARLTVTTWYLIIIMTITLLFSVVIYRVIYAEIDRNLHAQQLRQLRVQIEQGLISPFSQPDFDSSLLEESANRLQLILSVVDGIILLIAGGAGYFLAGKTLRPIQKMVDEQNRFVTDASHELNTPLTSLRTSIEVNLRDTHLTLEKAKKLLQSNLEEVDTLHLLSDDLIKLTQYQTQNGRVAEENVSLSDTIQDAVKKVKLLAEKKNISIHTKIGESIVKGDKKILRELFIILLDNAIKYSPEQTSIFVSSVITDHKINIMVADHGIGIDKKDLPFIFDRFYRADKSRTKQQYAGYGLGLSIAKRIVTVHHGTITVASIVGEGTTCTIQLPMGDIR